MQAYIACTLPLIPTKSSLILYFQARLPWWRPLQSKFSYKNCVFISQFAVVLRVWLPHCQGCNCHKNCKETVLSVGVTIHSHKQLGREWDTSKHNYLVSYLLCWRRHVSATVGHFQVTEMLRICTYTMIILCIVFLFIYFCDLKMVHSGRNMSSA